MPSSGKCDTKDLHGNMVTNSKKTPRTAAFLLPPVQHAEQTIQAAHLHVIEAVQEGSREEANGAHDGH